MTAIPDEVRKLAVRVYDDAANRDERLSIYGLMERAVMADRASRDLAHPAEDERKARILDGLLTARNIWTDHGSGFRVHFSFEASASLPWMSSLKKAHADAIAARRGGAA